MRAISWDGWEWVAEGIGIWSAKERLDKNPYLLVLGYKGAFAFFEEGSSGRASSFRRLVALEDTFGGAESSVPTPALRARRSWCSE